MADLTSYKGLCETVAEYLGRDDLSAQIPTFIRLAEKRMERDLRLRVMERRAVLHVGAGTQGVRLPCRRVAGEWNVFLEMRDIVWVDGSGRTHNLHYMPPDTYSMDREHGDVRGYTIIGFDLFLLPPPSGDGKLRLTYYAEIPPLGEAQPSNAVLCTAPDVYLYATLLESVPFTRGSVPAEQWAQFYGGARNKLEATEQRARFTSNLSMQPARRI